MRQKTEGYALRAFLTALLLAALIFLPFVVHDKGYFIYYGDFNVQQIPFYKLAHEAVRSGDVFWSWHTDLGANFIGSYGFYLLFSPFFWLTLPFPTSWLPFLMAPLLVLKTACAAFTAYLYLGRFLKDRRYAVIGALLYAFSGWMTFNIFFNHFHEAAVFFPLLPLAAEKLIQEDKKCFFALAVTVNAVVNYWFFVGEAVFMILYVFVRMSDKNFLMTAKKFLLLAFEAILGAALACVVLLPCVSSLLGNPRTGTDELLTGWNIWLYWNEQRLPAILQSMFFPPELPASPNFFPDHGAKWASLSAWLPLFSVTGVLAYFFARKNDWLKKLLALCLLFALVPVLNSLFVLLNHSYYARWFYMPVLFMALATVLALAESENGAWFFRRGVKWAGIISAVFLAMSALTPWLDGDELVIGLADDKPVVWIYGGFAAAGLILTAALVFGFSGRASYTRLLTAFLSVFLLAFTVFYIALGRNYYERGDFVINTALKGRGQISLPNETFARSDAFEAQDNLLMFWGLPNIQAFHSVVPESIMNFYPFVGVKRDVSSKPEPEFYALRPLLSVRWLFIEDKEDKDQKPMPGYVKYSRQAGFNVYENENFIPMGFSYDDCITPEALEQIEEEKRSNMMLRAVVLDSEGIARNTDILNRIEITGSESFSVSSMEKDATERRKYTADDFVIDARGFSAVTEFDEPRLVFFSVPWEKGWSASVNGESCVIERANIGFMAIRVPEGRAEIRFDYFTPGLLTGAYITLAALIIFLIYLWLMVNGRKKQPGYEEAMLTGQAYAMTFGDYVKKFGRRREHAARVQRAVDKSAKSDMPKELGEEEKTFKFTIDR